MHCLFKPAFLDEETTWERYNIRDESPVGVLLSHEGAERVDMIFDDLTKNSWIKMDTCELCQEGIWPGQEKAEMHYKDSPPTADSLIVHAECGLGEEMEVS